MKTFIQFIDEGKKKGLDGKECWDGYKLSGTKKKGGKTVDNCVKVEEQELKEYSPNVAYQAKGGKKSGKLGKSSVYSLRGKDESKKDFRKSHVKDVEGGYVGGGHKPTPGSLKKEDYYRGTGEKVVARTKKWMDKKGEKGAPGLDAMKARTAEHKAKRGVKSEGYQRDPDRQEKERKTSKQSDPSKDNFTGISGSIATIMKQNAAMKKAAAKKKGVKEEVVTELNRYGKETGKATGSINKRAGTPIKKGGSTDKALNYVRSKIRKETGKPEGQQKKVKGEKDRVQYGNRRTTPADSIAKRRQSAKDADAAMRDTRGT